MEINEKFIDDILIIDKKIKGNGIEDNEILNVHLNEDEKEIIRLNIKAIECEMMKGIKINDIKNYGVSLSCLCYKCKDCILFFYPLLEWVVEIKKVFLRKNGKLVYSNVSMLKII